MPYSVRAELVEALVLFDRPFDKLRANGFKSNSAILIVNLASPVRGELVEP
jgi:hypothetical protein